MLANGSDWSSFVRTISHGCGPMRGGRMFMDGPRRFARIDLVAAPICASSMRHPHAGALQPRQDLVTEIRHFAEIIHESQANAADAGSADKGQFPSNAIGRDDEWIPATR